MGTVPGTNVDVPARLVVRIGFKPGMDDVQLWVDPATPHPTGAADLQITVLDFRFDRIRLASGWTGGDDLYTVDGLAIDAEGLSLGTAYCFGDGSGTACPCGNPDPLPMSGGCANSTGAGAVLTGTGTASVGVADAVLHGAGLVRSQPGLYFQGENDPGGGLGLMFGDGLRCAGMNVVRLEVVPANPAGESQTSIDIVAMGGVAAGQTRYYQLWYRDPTGSPCGSGFNLSNGLRIDWLP
jgi:hypothetical protein